MCLKSMKRKDRAEEQSKDLHSWGWRSTPWPSWLHQRPRVWVENMRTCGCRSILWCHQLHWGLWTWRVRCMWRWGSKIDWWKLALSLRHDTDIETWREKMWGLTEQNLTWWQICERAACRAGNIESCWCKDQVHKVKKYMAMVETLVKREGSMDKVVERQHAKPAGAEPADTKIKSTESKSKWAMVKMLANESVGKRETESEGLNEKHGQRVSVRVRIYDAKKGNLRDKEWIQL